MEPDDEVTFRADEQAAQGVPSAKLRSREATGSSTATKSSSSVSVATTPAHAAPAAVFKRCCMRTDQMDGSVRDHYRRD